MNRITIKNKNNEYNIVVDKVKIVYSNNVESTDFICRTFQNYILKTQESDYSKDEELHPIVLYDDEYLKISDFELYYVDANYDITNESKLGSKSLFLKCLDMMLSKLEYHDSFQTLNIVLNDCVEELNDMLFDKSYVRDIKPMITSSLLKKNFVKLLSFDCYKEDFLVNNYDIGYNDKIIIQLNLIRKILKYSKRKSIIVIKIEDLNQELLDELMNFDSQIIVISNFISAKRLNVNDIQIITKEISIDFLDDEAIYNLLLDENKNYTIGTMKEALIAKYIYKK